MKRFVNQLKKLPRLSLLPKVSCTTELDGVARITPSPWPLYNEALCTLDCANAPAIGNRRTNDNDSMSEYLFIRSTHEAEHLP